MKILMMAPYVGLTYGGTSKAVLELTAELPAQQIHIDLITTNANGDEKLDVPINQWVDQNGYRIQYFDCWYHNDLILSRQLLTWLYRHGRDYDLLHSHTIFSPLVSMVHWIGRRHRIPYVMTPHGMLDPWALAYKARKKKRYYTMIERSHLMGASAIQALNSTEADHLKRQGLHHSIVVPNGIHPDRFEQRPNARLFLERFPHTQQRDLILFLSRIDPKKGLDLLASAFAAVHRQFPNTHLVVAGPDSIGFLPTVQTYFADAGCLDAVTFTGMVTGAMKFSALAAAQVYVLPSYSEGFSMSILEGMAAGLPCVITTTCNFPEAQEARAAEVVVPEVESLTAALLRCVGDRIYAETLGDRARQFIFDTYTWEQSAQTLLHAYRQIVREPAKSHTTAISH